MEEDNQAAIKRIRHSYNTKKQHLIEKEHQSKQKGRQSMIEHYQPLVHRASEEDRQIPVLLRPSKSKDSTSTKRRMKEESRSVIDKLNDRVKT